MEYIFIRQNPCWCDPTRVFWIPFSDSASAYLMMANSRHSTVINPLRISAKRFPRLNVITSAIAPETNNQKGEISIDRQKRAKFARTTTDSMMQATPSLYAILSCFGLRLNTSIRIIPIITHTIKLYAHRYTIFFPPS